MLTISTELIWSLWNDVIQNGREIISIEYWTSLHSLPSNAKGIIINFARRLALWNYWPKVTITHNDGTALYLLIVSKILENHEDSALQFS